jgi:MerR family transcriptional regulator/heat shock protein HspR
MSGPTSPPFDHSTGQPGPDLPVYVISVAAELTGLHPQTLRAYDRLGLVRPGRSGGGGRRYSWRDIEQLREVAELTAAGIGLEGVRRILELESEVAMLRDRLAGLEEGLAMRQAMRQAVREYAAEPTVPNLPVLRPARHAVAVWRRPLD